MPLKFPFAIVMALITTPVGDARAGASLLVDDAAITPAGHCQVEAWARAYAPGQELTAVPACNLAGTEFGLGLSQYAHPSHGPIASLGLKHLLRDFDTHDWGLGVSLATTWNGAHNHGEGWALNVPASVALDPQRRTVLHANLGWSEPRNGPDALTGGLGIEHVLAAEWTLLAEAFGDHRGGFTAQLGVRRALNDRASLDLMLGHQDGMKHAPWLTVGLNVLLPN
ncbi:hypothetical protein ACFOLC_08590 [Lysobacter cavernae]|uniref:Transporter n=1 Tax=Lysobacter cavernae TaxID=1685901 RepID=A0ABV7RN66_9GAMM